MEGRMSGYDTDDILSEALDLAENEDENIFITQSSFQKYEDKDPITLSEVFAIDSAIDVSDMLDFGGPCLVQATMRIDTADQRKTDSSSSSKIQAASMESEGKCSSKRFLNVTGDSVESKTKPFITSNTLKKNTLAVNLFQEWKTEFLLFVKPTTDESAKYIAQLLSNTSYLSDYNNDDLEKVLRYFFTALKKEDGSDYTGDSIFAILCSLQRHLQCNGKHINFFTHPDFRNLKTVVDNMMQEKCEKGIGLIKKKADIITEEQEKLLWENGYLGASSPIVLLHTIVWIVGVHFGLRGGDEHRRLSFANLQNKTDEDTTRYLEYTESMSKANKGGIKHRRFEPHKCRVYENNTDECPIKIYQKYINLLPEKRDESSFYFQPLSKPKPHVWFFLQSVGHNKLEGLVKGIMSAAGFVGNFSNHSLRASTTTRLYRAGVSDQLIKEQTGHRSNAIEAYKRTSHIQKRDVSRVIS